MNNKDYLAHHGVKGMKWGVRRYQNYDGTRIKNSKSYTLKKGTEFTRYSPKKNDLHDSQYMSQSKWDKDMYMHDTFTSEQKGKYEIHNNSNTHRNNKLYITSEIDAQKKMDLVSKSQ